MKFYTKLHDFYCGIDLHARILYVCILNREGEKVLHQKIKAEKSALAALISPYLGNLVIGVECMHCWYWVSDWCEQQNIDFLLGHALYMVVKQKMTRLIRIKSQACLEVEISL